MKQSVFALIVAFGGIAALLAQAPATIVPQPLWTVNTGLVRPKSAYYHQQSNSIFVSNHSGGRFNKDGNGYITRLAPDGTVLAKKWAAGLNAPKGIGSVGSTIWVVDVEEIVGFEMTAGGGRLRSRVRIDGARGLHDLALAPDGTIFVSQACRYPPSPDCPPRIYMIKDGQPSIFVEGEAAGWLPIGLLVDGARLIVGTLDRGIGKDARIQGAQLVAFDLQTGARTILATTMVVGQVGGSRRLIHVDRDGKVTALARFEHGGGHIAVSPAAKQLQQAGTLFVPFPNADSVSAYDLSTLIRAATN